MGMMFPQSKNGQFKRAMEPRLTTGWAEGQLSAVSPLRMEYINSNNIFIFIYVLIVP